MVTKLFKWLETHPVVAAVMGAVLALLMLYAGDSFSQWRHTRAVNKQDAQIQSTIDAAAKAAEETQNAADQHAGERQAAEGRAELADEQKQQAAANSNRTIEQVRKARDSYEKTRRSSPADSPAISDDQLCAELAKRGIACR
jgi:ParB-like chromosome segregation protein Spo0J